MKQNITGEPLQAGSEIGIGDVIILSDSAFEWLGRIYLWSKLVTGQYIGAGIQLDRRFTDV